MRKITEEVCRAFLGIYKYKKSNSEVKLIKNNYLVTVEVRLLLFGNIIAKRDLVNNETLVCDGGYKTRTTKERLNGLPNVHIHQVKGNWYLNKVYWEGEWTKIN